MKPFFAGAAWLATLGLVVASQAAPNLGMKLACKHYGDAWNSGSRSALNGQITSDFASVFNRMPSDMFARMPRSGGGGKVLSSRKGAGSGTVTVATSQGVMTFVVVGRGFQWRVADIYKSGDDGRTVSLKNYLDAQLTAREFIHDLKYVGGTSHHDSTSRAFRAAFAELSRDDLDRVRAILPELRKDIKPYLTMNGSTATMTVRFPGLEGYARFNLVHEGSWKVDDYSVAFPHASIASFRSSLDTIAAIGRFRQFMLEPAGMDPCQFVAAGPLRDSLVRVHENGSLPMHQVPSPMKKLTIDASGENVRIDMADRSVLIQVDRTGPGAMVAKVDVTLGKRWADLGHLIALNERARSAFTLAGIAQPRAGAGGATAIAVAKPVARTSDASVLENASAKEVTATAKPIDASSKTVDSQVRPAVATIARTGTSGPIVKPVSYQASVQPQRVYYAKKKAGIFRAFRGR